MVSPKSRTRESTVPCDFCNQQIAVVYCKADSAKLCLFCDHEVHSANALSGKHLRSQICDNCSSNPASVACSTDNLLLCNDCDSDAHGTSASHVKNPIECFSGCPSALELASAWGIDLNGDDDKKPQHSKMGSNWTGHDMGVMPFDSWMYKSAIEITLQDLMVPIRNSMIYSDVCGGVDKSWKRPRLSCGNQNRYMVRQLVELFKRELLEMNGGDSADGGGGGAGSEGVVNQEEPSAARKVIVQTHVDATNSVQIAERAQIWDFHSGQLRAQEESSALDVKYNVETAAGYTMRGFVELLKDSSLRNNEDFEEMYDLKEASFNCSATNEEIAVYRINPNRPSTSMGSATSTSNNNLRVAKSSALDETKTEATKKAEMETLAQNRGYAMLRYKEKKKNRRYDKQIRYESRKARADTRKRVKGRFVKASEGVDC